MSKLITTEISREALDAVSGAAGGWVGFKDPQGQPVVVAPNTGWLHTLTHGKVLGTDWYWDPKATPTFPRR
jgi:hypothetical protein